MIKRLRTAIILVSDILALFFALCLVILIRFDSQRFVAEFQRHILSFAFVFGLWLLIFYILKLYDLTQAKNRLEFWNRFLIAFLVNFIVAGLVFYSIPFGITPKTNLVIVSTLSFIFVLLNRVLINKIFKNIFLTKVCLIGQNNEIKEIERFILDNPQCGFKQSNEIESDIIICDEIKTIFPNDEKLAVFFNKGGKVIKIADFYEIIFNKIPLEIMTESDLIKMGLERKPSDVLKRWKGISLSICLLILLFPLFLLCAFLIKITSSGPVFYHQLRIGKGGKSFWILKFRTMVKNAEQIGPEYTEKNDPRITIAGKILRPIHLDELPQLWNILKGEMSFVGPRPESEQLSKKYSQQIKWHVFRYFVRPGITGFTQLNYPYGENEEDAKERLKYDLFYIKNRSLIFDIGIFLQTIRRVFEKHAR